jgi:SAM-dependent methyltransferase
MPTKQPPIRSLSKFFKNKFKSLLGITKLHQRIDNLERIIFESEEVTLKRSKARWLKAEPTKHLTWGKNINGDEFIRKLISYNLFSYEKTILEVGPGYGRLLKSCLSLNVPFNLYCGVDISENNVRHLSRTFAKSNIKFFHGDIETISFENSFDIVLSSLTFKHIYPTFEKTLLNIASFMKPNSYLCFDLIEGHKRFFEPDGTTYIRLYTQEEVNEILKATNFSLVAFDYVEHAPEFTRLLVITKKS